LAEAAEELNIPHVGTLEAFERLPDSQESAPVGAAGGRLSSYTSGSTLFRGVMITQRLSSLI
jgi:hypothetical protein